MTWLRELWLFLTRNKGLTSLEGANAAWEAFAHRVNERLMDVEKRLDVCLADCADCHAARDRQQGEIDQLRRRVAELEK